MNVPFLGKCSHYFKTEFADTLLSLLFTIGRSMRRISCYRVGNCLQLVENRPFTVMKLKSHFNSLVEIIASTDDVICSAQQFGWNYFFHWKYVFINIFHVKGSLTAFIADISLDGMPRYFFNYIERHLLTIHTRMCWGHLKYLKMLCNLAMFNTIRAIWLWKQRRKNQFSFIFGGIISRTSKIDCGDCCCHVPGSLRLCSHCPTAAQTLRFHILCRHSCLMRVSMASSSIFILTCREGKAIAISICLLKQHRGE